MEKQDKKFKEPEVVTQLWRSLFTYAPLIRQVEGWLSEQEGALLYLYAFLEIPGEIVEIGSWKGKSTCWLASGVRDSGKNLRVNAIDHHIGSEEHKKLKGFSGNTYPEFIANIEKLSLTEYVKPIVKTSMEAVKTWKKDIGLLFIDGSHHYEDVREDWIKWTKFVPIGGTVVLDDTSGWEGPKCVAQEFIDDNEDWLSFKYGKMTVATRIK